MYTFESVYQKAKALHNNTRVGLVNPDESLMEAALLAERDNIISCTTFSSSGSSADTALEQAILAMEKGEVDTLAKGQINTSVFLKGILKSQITTGYVAHTSILELQKEQRLVIVSDGTVAISPDLQQKAQIIAHCLTCAATIGIPEPKVAILSANELLTPSLQSGIDAASLCKMAERGQLDCEYIDGPLSLDTALSAEAACKKGLSFRFTPPADILIVPDLESGAFLIKTAVYLGQSKVAGLLWGTRHPIVLTSRADSMEGKFFSLCLCSIAKSLKKL